MSCNKLPPRWINCPRKGEIILGLFLPFKTPLDSKYFSKISPASYFTPEMVIHLQKTCNFEISLWIDLTKTNRYYDKKVIEDVGIKFCKISCDGHKSAPNELQTNCFIKLCDSFISKFPKKVIALHCTHGFNRTGFLICAYLCQKLDWSPDAALSLFASSRPPGIYKADYIVELFRRYGVVEDAPEAPIKPNWSFENEGVDDDGNEILPTKSDSIIQNKILKKKDTFMEGISGVEIVSDIKLHQEIQNLVLKMTNYSNKDFPGSQPVSMTVEDLGKLIDKSYKVSWKADGVRYLMYIKDKDEIYLLDRDNVVFKIVEGCPLFPKRNNLNEHITETLVDGEMVIDVVDGVNYPKFLIYDIIKFLSITLYKENFKVRTECINKEIIEPRNEAKRLNIIDRSLESFSIRIKYFWPVEVTKTLFSEKFNKSLHHEVDGLIFQPVDEPYKFGAFDLLLKWKPPILNSIDFRLKIFKENRQGCLPETYAYLYVGRTNELFAKVKATKEFRENDNKIVECTYDYINRTWKFLRVRTDKSFPNSSKTAFAVLETIKKPLTKEFLLDYIEKNICNKKSTKGLMLPPPRPL